MFELLELFERVDVNDGAARRIQAILANLEHADSAAEFERSIALTTSETRVLIDRFLGKGRLGALEKKLVETVAAEMLANQDRLFAVVDDGAGELAARGWLIAAETLRRLLRVVAGFLADPAIMNGAPPSPAEVAPFEPSIQFFVATAGRLLMLTLAIEHLCTRGRPQLVSELARKAFETSQTLRHLASDLGFDLTPWLDAPAELRARRIADAAQAIFERIPRERLDDVRDAWNTRTKLRRHRHK